MAANAIISIRKKQDIEPYAGKLHLNEHKPKQISVPKNIVDTAINNLKALADIKNDIKAAKLAGEEVFKVVLKPELTDGLKNGTLTWDGYSCLLRRAGDNKIAGHINVEKFDLERISEAQAAVSGITKMICSVSGQIQIAEINEKLDKLQGTVDKIRNEAWRDRTSKLSACASTIYDVHCGKYEHEENALSDIMAAKDKVKDLMEFFRNSICEELKRKINLKSSKSIWEAITYWFQKEKNDYNTDYINEIKDLLSEYSFFVDLYLEARKILYIAYQYIGEYHLANDMYEESRNFIENNNSGLLKKIMYHFEILDYGMQYNNLSSLDSTLTNNGVHLSDSLYGTARLISVDNNLSDINAEIEVDIPISLLEVDYD